MIFWKKSMQSCTKIITFSCIVLLVFAKISIQYEQDDNEFAEFENFDDDTEKVKVDSSQTEQLKATQEHSNKPEVAEDETASDLDAMVEDEDEFEHLHDSDEFEGLEKSSSKNKNEPDKLTIANIPHHLRTNWDSYYIEMLMLSGLAVYFLNFISGKTKNNRLAQAWLKVSKELLENNFALIGDDGVSKEVDLPGNGEWLKESESVYTLWCSGRVGCEGMLITLKLLKRHDLVSTIAQMFKPKQDQLTIHIDLDEMDSFVFLLANKKLCSKLHKEMNDLSLYCTEKKSGERFDIPSSFSLVSEIGEATAAVLDRTVVAALKTYEKYISYIHVSDQYSGPKIQDQAEPPVATPTTKKVLTFGFSMDSDTKNIDDFKPLMRLVFYCVEKVRRIRLSKEAKMKADKNRSRVEEKILKASHAQRQEAAQTRRDEKRRVEKERIMNEEDPDKQRKLEEKENKREAKRRHPKMKMMKVKG